MKVLVTLVRILVGLLFIFSGLVKANDPLGLSYKMQEFFELWDMSQYPPGCTIVTGFFKENRTTCLNRFVVLFIGICHSNPKRMFGKVFILNPVTFAATGHFKLSTLL